MQNEAMKAYRDWLVETEHKASESYDKAVMTLSGGALAISLTFVKNVAQPVVALWRLESAWVALTVSVGSILVSMPTSQIALRHSIHQVDEGKPTQRPGGMFSIATEMLNVLATVTFIGGIALLAWFSLSNVK
jgi:hypothetical protein